MAGDDKSSQVGTGQQGSGTRGVNWERNSHLEEQTTEDKVNEIAEDVAIKGKERQHREDPTIFTK